MSEPRGQAPRPRRARRQLLACCPWCLIVDVAFRTLVANAVTGLSKAELLRPDQVAPPFVRYRCPCAACGYEEIHLEVVRA